MFKPATLKIVSLIALVCCSLGILFSIIIAITSPGMRTYLSVLSWVLLAYSSWLGTKLSGYELYEEDLKRLGYYVYGILVLFVLYLFINLSLGILPAIFLAISLHNQKRGFDNWMRENREL